MARIAEVGGAKAKEYGDCTAISTFVFQKIGTMFGAHLGPCHIATSAAHQFGGIVFVTDFGITSGFATIVSFLAFKANIIRVPVHGVLCQILVIDRLNDAFIFETGSGQIMFFNETRDSRCSYRINAFRLTSFLRLFIGSRTSTSN